MYNKIKKKITSKLKRVLKKKPNYEQMYEAKCKESDKWEFKYNKLNRQLKAIIKESDA